MTDPTLPLAMSGLSWEGSIENGKRKGGGRGGRNGWERIPFPVMSALAWKGWRDVVGIAS